MLKIILHPTIIMAWVKPHHEQILNEHQTAYQSAISEAEKADALKSITNELRALGKKGLPRKLAKVGNPIPMLHVSHI
jgi:hypothetical protein